MRTESGPVFYFVTGATGWVGRHVVRELAQRGEGEVRVAVRARARSAADRFSDLLAFAKPSRPTRLVEFSSSVADVLPHDTTHVVHCAGLASIWNERALLAANVGATWDLLTAASRLSGLRRFVHVSTLLVRTDCEHPFTEDMLEAGQSHLSAYSLTKLLGEIAVRRFYKLLPSTVIRVGSALAPTSMEAVNLEDWFHRTVSLWLEGRITYIPLSKRQRFYPVPVDVLASAMAHVIHSLSAPPVLHLPFEAGPTVQDAFQRMAESAGVRPPGMCCQNTGTWRQHCLGLPPTVRRMLACLYPPTRGNRGLAKVLSSRSRHWFTREGVRVPSIASTYWGRLAQTIQRVYLCSRPRDGSTASSRESGSVEAP